MTLSANINYNLDSNHIITVELDSSLAEEIINTIGFKQIIKAKTLEGYYEYFILTGVDKELDDIITLTGIHWLTETTSKIFCKDLKPRGLNANLMLKHIVEGSEEYKNNIQYAKDIETSGNIDSLVNCNLWQTSLGDYLENLQELYGKCEVRKRGFTLSLMDYVGSRTPCYTVNYGENLISSTASEEYILVKGVLPTGYDGIRGNIVYSEKISSGITKVIEYPVRLRVEGEEDEESYSYYNTLEECQKALEDLAQKEFEVNKIDEIGITYDINFLDLATTVEEGNGEKTYLTVGDVVNTRIDKYNLDINTRVVEMDYDVLEEEIKDVVLSNAAISSLKVPTLNSVNKEIENKPSLEEVISITKLESTNILNAGMQNSYVVVKKVINDDGTVVDGEILVMDSPNADNAVNVWRWNKNGLMHSNSGYNGIYTMGLRYDGIIFADLIRAGILKSFNNKTWINMEDGTFNFGDKIKFDGNSFTVDITGEDLNDNASMNLIIDKLQIEYKDADKKLEGSITQTAESLRSEYKDADKKLESGITQTAESLRTEYKDIQKGLESQIQVNADAIKQKVESKDFQSYKDQTDREISSKIEGKDVSTIVKQNADSWGISVGGKLKGINYNFDGENFSIGNNNGNTNAYHSAAYSKWKHTDGSYTQVSADGIYRQVSMFTRHSYHYLMHAGTVQVENTVWVNLPSHIANKVGTNYAVSISVKGYGFNDNRTRALMQVYCTVLSKSADAFQIRVDLYGWRPEQNDWRGQQTIGGWVNVDYVIVA